MHALFLVSREECSGAAHSFVQAACGLARQGLLVTVACKAGSEVAARAHDGGIPVLDLPHGGGALRTIWWLRGVLRNGDVDVVFVHTASEARVAGLARRLAARGRVVRRSPGIAELGIDLAALAGIGPAARVSLRAPREGPLVACWCTRNASRPAVHALRVLARLSRRHPDLHALMLGPGAADEGLRVQAAAVGLRGVITWISDEMAARRALRAADIGWVAAEGEDTGFALLECMAARVAVVAGDEPTARHVLGPDGAGILVDAADADLDASALAILVSHPEHRARIAEAARSRVEHAFSERALIAAFAGALATGDPVAAAAS